MTRRADLPTIHGPASSNVALAVGSMVSGERVLSALHTATDLRQARALSDDDLRSALAVAHAAGELIAERAGHALRPRGYVLADLALDAATIAVLSGRTGATARQVDRGLELLLASQVLLRVPGQATVRLSRECLVDIPSGGSTASLAPIQDALVTRRAAVMPALAVLRYLHDLPSDVHGRVVSSLQQAAARTFFKRSTVARALVDLEAVGAIERAHGPGLRGHYRIVPSGAGAATERAAAGLAPDDRRLRGDDPDISDPAFDQSVGLGVPIGLPPMDSEVALPRHAEVPVPSAAVPELHPARPDSQDVTVGMRSATVCAVLEVAGVAFPIPAGATLQPEFDEQGRLWYRLGSARIGPITV